ncbi:hypothetical protein M0811_12957 [Anaeramoeba ignava]|uniref:Uncharacterized protein n=1 Tax=Anaeramoeba ignava TaxID=1746090 RepID=A0A9Q0R4X4_ANAIG|nr:hypothetical protein M0811_12957 [Anaeramoeba ignava]
MKHLLFLQNQFKNNFNTILKELPDKFKKEMIVFQISSVEKCLKDLNIPEFFQVLKEFIKKIRNNINSNYPIKSLILFSIEDKNSKIYQNIENNFDNQKTILMANTFHLYEFLLQKTKRK